MRRSDSTDKPLTVEVVRDALAGAGFPVAAADLRLDRREDRWAVSLPGDRMAWFPANGRGRERLEVERRVLGLLNDRCGFATPKVLAVGEGGFDVRALVPGVVDPWAYYARVKTDEALAVSIGRSVAAILADQHGAVVRADVEGWLDGVANWPLPRAQLEAQLPRVIDDADLLARIGRGVARYFETPVAEADRALVHTDLGLHNMAFDPETDAVNGVFDYDSAAWADRHHDFRYLIFHAASDATLDAAIETYEAATGLALHRDRILLYNAAAAIGHLANRMGHGADENVSGRTLAEDLDWTDWALKRVGF